MVSRASDGGFAAVSAVRPPPAGWTRRRTNAAPELGEMQARERGRSAPRGAAGTAEFFCDAFAKDFWQRFTVVGFRAVLWCTLALCGIACGETKHSAEPRSDDDGTGSGGQPAPGEPGGAGGGPSFAGAVGSGGDIPTAGSGGEGAHPPSTSGGEGGQPAPPVPEQPPISLTEDEAAALDYVDAANTVLRGHYVDCFNYTASTIENTYFSVLPTAPMASIRAGLVVFDAEQSAECLRQLSRVACIDLVENRFPEACGVPPWVGTVPPGGYCLGSVDCAEPAHQCVDSSNACGRSCEPVPVEATAEPTAEGEPCGPIDDCVTGTFCKPAISNSFEGVCQSIEPDQPCSGSWECPWPYACVEDEPGQGSCTAGRLAGESCTVRDFPRLNGWTDHDCAATTQCETAGGASTGICVAAVAWRGADSPREAYRAVTEGSFCQLYPEVQPCGFEQFCSVDPAVLEAWKSIPAIELLPDLTGECRPLRREGEPCRSGEQVDCVPNTICQDGVCTRCP
jgi:hypothetical protein